MFNNGKIKEKNITLNFNDNNNNNNIDYESITKMEEKEFDLINESLINNVKELKNKKDYYPNFYQKKIFIDFLYSEIEKFMQCAYLDGNLVFEKILPFFKELRSDIIDSLIKNSIYFTFSPFDKIISEENTLSNCKNSFQREKQYDEMIQKLQKEKINDIINYEKIEPSIMAFHENGIDFSIISTNENDLKFKYLKEYIKIVNSLQKELFDKNKKKKKNINENYEENKYLKKLKFLMN